MSRLLELASGIEARLDVVEADQRLRFRRLSPIPPMLLDREWFREWFREWLRGEAVNESSAFAGDTVFVLAFLGGGSKDEDLGGGGFVGLGFWI